MIETERLDRAGKFVLGRMGNMERERAERDLAKDPSFRAAVMRLAVNVRDGEPAGEPAETIDSAEQPHRGWHQVAKSLAALPHMRDLTVERQLMLASSVANDIGVAQVKPAKRHSARFAGAIVAALVVIFGLGYQAGRVSNAPGQAIAAMSVDQN